MGKKGENKRKKRSRDTDTDGNEDGDGDGFNFINLGLFLFGAPLLLKTYMINKKKKRQELIPMIVTITKHISITKTITLTNPLKNPEIELCLYLCLEKASDPDGHCSRWYLQD
ncbi:hypothetical protein LguiA_025579 [Lonicera macranthoides]